jgi:hypothetical protein
LLEQEFNREDWNAKTATIGLMGDASTPIDSRQEADDDSQRAPSAGDDGHTTDGGAELQQEMVIPLEVVLQDVVAEKAANAEIKSAADQEVQHLRHFLFMSVISFSISLFFTLLFNQVLTIGDIDSGSAADQQVEHLSHFLSCQLFLCFFYLCHFLHCFSIRFLEAQLETLLVVLLEINWLSTSAIFLFTSIISL